jgi:hypothetical protein
VKRICAATTCFFVTVVISCLRLGLISSLKHEYYRTSYFGRIMAQVVIRRSVKSKVQVLYLARVFETCINKGTLLQVLFLVLRFSPVSIILPLLLTHLLRNARDMLVGKTSGRILKTCKVMIFQISGEQRREK